jgi:hypothetical protein
MQQDLFFKYNTTIFHAQYVLKFLWLFIKQGKYFFKCCKYQVDTHGQARGTFKTIQASLDLNPGFSGIVHI